MVGQRRRHQGGLETLRLLSPPRKLFGSRRLADTSLTLPRKGRPGGKKRKERGRFAALPEEQGGLEVFPAALGPVVTFCLCHFAHTSLTLPRKGRPQAKRKKERGENYGSPESAQNWASGGGVPEISPEGRRRISRGAVLDGYYFCYFSLVKPHCLHARRAAVRFLL